MQVSREYNSFGQGLTDGLPICFGYLSVSFAFGIFTVANGLSALEALIISMTNVTSAGQLAAVPIIAGGGTLAELALSQFVINLRYSLMSVSLSQRLGNSVSFADRFWISFMNTDEVFALASSRPDPVGRKYMAGLVLTPYLGWSVGTIAGALMGDVLPGIVTDALGIAIYAMFVAIVVPDAKKSAPVALCAAAAAGISCLFRFLPRLSSVPGGFTVIICAVSAAAVTAALAPLPEQTGEGT